MSFKRLFSRTLGAAPDRLHFAAHSHHLWPNASFEGQVEAWEDAAQLADRKWDKVMGEVWPEAQRHVAEVSSLTGRERETLSLMCEGMDDAAVAAAMGVSRNTVRNNVARIYGKLGVNRRSAAIIWARERGFPLPSTRRPAVKDG